MATLETINLHLIGKQGPGKSITGNSILGKKAFGRSISKTDNCPMKAVCEIKYARLPDSTLNVWDWPGMDETSEKTSAICENLKKLKAECSVEPNQFLLWVMRYGEICDQEDEELLKILTAELGESIITDHTIIILTHKDNFDRDVEETQLTFQEWVKKQTGFFKSLYKMCKDRLLFFNNREQRPDQVNDLINIISDLLLKTPKKISRHSPLPPTAQPEDFSAYETLPAESEKKQGCSESLSSSIDEFHKILSDSTHRETVGSLLFLLGKLQNTKGRRGEDVKDALEREIGRQIEDHKAFANMEENTVLYLGKLKQKLQLECVDEDDFVVLAPEVVQSKG